MRSCFPLCVSGNNRPPFRVAGLDLGKSKRPGGKRRLFAEALLLMLFSCSVLLPAAARGGEEEPLPVWKGDPGTKTLQGGLCTIELPEVWVVGEDFSNEAIMLSDAPLSESALAIYLPNPYLTAEQAIALEIGLMSRSYGFHRIVRATRDTVDGNPHYRVDFTFPVGDTTQKAQIQLTDFDGFRVLSIATALEKDYDKFIAQAEQVVASYRPNMEAIRKRETGLRRFSALLLKRTLERILGPEKEKGRDVAKELEEVVKTFLPPQFRTESVQ